MDESNNANSSSRPRNPLENRQTLGQSIMQEDVHDSSMIVQDVTQIDTEGPNSPHMFTETSHLSVQGANRFTNVGGSAYYVNPSLSVVVQHDTIPNPSAAVASAIERPAGVPNQFVQQPEHESEVYARILMPKRHGYPLWYAEPSSNLQPEHRESGIRIGDVGLITANGGFDFLFNICLPSDDPINGNSVPEDFQPITPGIEDRDMETNLTEWKPGSHVINGSVRTLEPRSITEFIGQYSFEGFSSEGALLTLPEGAKRVDLLSLASFCDYAGKNGHSWYKFANGRRGRMAANGSLYLVTGFHKARSWGTASFSSVVGDSAFKMTFMKSTPIGRGPGGRLQNDASYRSPFMWNETGCAATKEGPYFEPGRFDAGTDRPINQTVFLRGFRVALAESIWASLMRKVHVVPISDMNSRTLSQKDRFVPFLRGQSTWARNFTFGTQSNKNGGRQYSDNSQGSTGSGAILVSDVAAPRVDLHPLNYINQQLLKKFPEAEVVVTHDNVWCTALDEEILASRNQAEWFSRISQKYHAVCTNGVVTLTSREVADRSIKPKPEIPLISMPNNIAISRAHAIKLQGAKTAINDNGSAIGTIKRRTFLPPEMPRAWCHAIPSGPWPWADFNDVRHEKGPVSTQKSSKTDPPNWREYPQSTFASWQPAHIRRSKIQEAIEYNPDVCTLRCVDILTSPPFTPRESVVQAGQEDHFWEEIQQSPPEGTKLRAIFLDRPSGPVLQMVGTKYRIEPSFWSSSLNRLPSRYRDESREGLGDHITITLPFINVIDSDIQGYTNLYKGGLLPVTDDGSRCVVQELLAVHLIRSVKHGNTIITFHPNGSRQTSAEHLQSRIVDAGRSVYWTEILENTKDPTFILLIFMWYAMYAWDQALQELHVYISSLEERVIGRSDTSPTKILHNIQAHLINYQSLLRDFTESIKFILDSPNPAQDYGEEERKRLEKECKHLLSEVERMEIGRHNYQERLKNVTNMLISTVNIDDSHRMRMLTQAAVKDSRAMKQISILTMIFLPASFVASTFGMNIGLLIDGGHGTLLHFIETVIPLTILTIWFIVASQTGASGGDVQSRGWQRLAWPYNVLGNLLRGRRVSKLPRTTSDSTIDLEAQIFDDDEGEKLKTD